MQNSLPLVIADGPLAPAILELLDGRVELLPWELTATGSERPIDGIYSYGHLTVDGPVLDRLPGVKVVSNYGVGVDHIHLADAAARGVPVGNTPGVLDGATADMGFTLLLAGARRLAEGDRYSRSDGFTHYDPGYMLGQEAHGAVIGIFGMGRIGQQVARRALAFDMQVVYHNRRRREDLEASLPARYLSKEELLATADYVMLCTPLTAETTGYIGAAELALMKPTALLVNIARGAVVDTDALTNALAERQIFGAALDVTDPEPLPRGHRLLELDNVTIAPHLGSATVQTRQRMAEMSVANLLAGLSGQPLPHQVQS
ncbi:2-hydroxyacid dehydrogenase [Lignipirellula cremea]|uniref:Glyoxylate/hydroxypyruvate reductase B n=1 Tax=Lignipirellula cremea TaxID=2528010 RepID=A0A518DU38_9BACT|nr:D-glycerate dehydrogenase [Lignipirellula cremea]QDU95338.1 Glyoxylate/hydroxypyruvate reductase B [Lignipirellula cremea]